MVLTLCIVIPTQWLPILLWTTFLRVSVLFPNDGWVCIPLTIIANIMKWNSTKAKLIFYLLNESWPPTKWTLCYFLLHILHFLFKIQDLCLSNFGLKFHYVLIHWNTTKLLRFKSLPLELLKSHHFIPEHSSLYVWNKGKNFCFVFENV